VLVHDRIVGLGIRSDCRPAKDSAIPNTSGAFHRWNRMTEGIAPWSPDRTSSLRNRDFRLCSVESPRLFDRTSSPGADDPKRGWCSARLMRRGVIHNFSVPPPA